MPFKNNGQRRSIRLRELDLVLLGRPDLHDALTFLDDDGDAEVNFDEFKKIIISGTAVEVRIPNPKPDPNPNPNHVPNPNPNR